MRQVDPAESQAVVQLMRRFMPLTRCGFAPLLTRQEPFGRTVWPVAADLDLETDTDLPHWLDGLFDEAAAQECVAIVVLPELRAPRDVVRVLRLLARGDRWTIQPAAQGKHMHEDLLVTVLWRTPAGDRMSVMGLGPFGEMPATRRAPFVALAVWPGRPSNPHRAAPAGEVGLIHAALPPGLETDRAEYDRLWAQTRSDVRALRRFPPHDSARPDIAFCLPGELGGIFDAFARP